MTNQRDHQPLQAECLEIDRSTVPGSLPPSFPGGNRWSTFAWQTVAVTATLLATSGGLALLTLWQTPHVTTDSLRVLGLGGLTVLALLVSLAGQIGGMIALVKQEPPRLYCLGALGANVLVFSATYALLTRTF